MTDHAARRLDSLDVVRGLSISLVIIDHYFGRLPPDFPQFAGHLLHRIANIGWVGVDLFFVLSGYLIGTILMRNREAGNYPTAFYGRRVLRIMPLYVVDLIVFLLLRAFLDWSDPADAVFFQPYGSAWTYLTMVQNIDWAVRGQWGPGWLALTWSLAVEEQFYLLLPALVRFVPARTLPRWIAGFVVLAPVLRIAFRMGYGNTLAPYLLFPCRMDALFLGVLVAWLGVNGGAGVGDRLLRPCRIVALAGGAVLAALTLGAPRFVDPTDLYMQTLGYTLVDVTLAALLFVVVRTWGAGWSVPPLLQPARWLGLAAYPIYLFHRPVQFAVERLLRVHGTRGLLVDLAVTGGLGAACWLWIERPLIAWGARRLRYSDHRPASDGGLLDAQLPV